MKELLNYYQKLKQKDIYVLYIDFQKAFDSVDHKILEEKIRLKVHKN